MRIRFAHDAPDKCARRLVHRLRVLEQDHRPISEHRVQVELIAEVGIEHQRRPYEAALSEADDAFTRHLRTTQNDREGICAAIRVQHLSHLWYCRIQRVTESCDITWLGCPCRP